MSLGWPLPALPAPLLRLAVAVARQRTAAGRLAALRTRGRTSVASLGGGDGSGAVRQG